MPDEQTPLDLAVAELAVPGTDHDREQLTALRDRLAAGRLRVVVAGESQRGESTLIIAQLGQAVLPMGVTPLTTVVGQLAPARWGIAAEPDPGRGRAGLTPGGRIARLSVAMGLARNAAAAADGPWFLQPT
jgi:hypothetical protein